VWKDGEDVEDFLGACDKDGVVHDKDGQVVARINDGVLVDGSGVVFGELGSSYYCGYFVAVNGKYVPVSLEQSCVEE
jgi:hypothetical protein